MRIELTVFEDENQVKRGLLRALAAMCFISFFSFLWYALIRKQLPTENKAWVGVMIIFVLLGSAIAVQFPTDARTAIVYGFMLGLLVYGVSTGTRLLTDKNETLLWAGAEITRGTFATMMTAFLVYKIFF